MGALGGLVWIVVTAVLAELHGARRNVALSEASAVAYAFGITAPLTCSLFGGDILRKFLGRVYLGKSTSVPLQC